MPAEQLAAALYVFGGLIHIACAVVHLLLARLGRATRKPAKARPAPRVDGRPRLRLVQSRAALGGAHE